MAPLGVLGQRCASCEGRRAADWPLDRAPTLGVVEPTEARVRKAKVRIQDRVGLFLRLYAELTKEPYAQGVEVSISFTFGGAGDSIETNTQRQEFRSYLVLFRQLISPRDNVYLGTILGELPRHVDDQALRGRLSAATDGWEAANGIVLAFAPIALGPFASGRELARLYLYGGVFHSDLELSQIWDAAGVNQRALLEYRFRQFEGRIRLVYIELKKIIDEAREAGAMREEPLDLGDPTPS
jgi:hypothetical protein